MEKKGKRKLKWKVKAVLLIALAVGVAAGFWLYQDSLVYKVCRVEAGVSFSVNDFLKREDENAYFTVESDPVDITVPGEYHLKVRTGFLTHNCTLYIEDTIAPEATAAPVRIEYGEKCEAMDFVTGISDATATTVSFVEEPDFELMENQKVLIAVTDAGNNTTTLESELIVSLVVDCLTLEAGSPPPSASDFVLIGSEAEIITDLGSIDFSHPSSRKVVVELYGTRYSIPMEIVDTTAPVFTVKDMEGYAIVERKPEDFVVSAEDVTELTYSFETEPDLHKIGVQTVAIVATDEGGNQARQEARLTLMEDTEPPTIEGAADMTVFLGSSVSYRANVKARDNCEEGLVLAVDASAVNINEVGTYPVVYTATDCAGNSAAASINLTVRERVYDINEIDAVADSILAGIITEDMSLRDRALAIFNYVKSHVSYTSYSEKENWVKAAYEGLVDGRGDCFVYACTSRELLTRAGISNMDIERIPSGSSMHYWNLVDIGDGWGWYHFDTTPRQDHPTIFLWTEAQITEYSNNHYNCHNYDRSLYPHVN